VTQASLPAGVPSGSFGPGVAAIVSLVTGKYRLSKRLAQQLVSDVLGIELCIGSIASLEQQMSTAVAAPVEQARDDVRQQSLVNIDETGWYEGREGGRPPCVAVGRRDESGHRVPDIAQPRRTGRPGDSRGGIRGPDRQRPRERLQLAGAEPQAALLVALVAGLPGLR
jgi:hypothetical protein